MLRRKATRQQSPTLGAFVDTKGSIKKQKLSRDAVVESGDDEVEEKLEALVFGKQLFQSSSSRLTEGDSSSSEESDDGETFSKDAGDLLHPRKPAWYDDDDEEVRVDISADQRLRKLRKAENETMIPGAVFNKRLRDQFEKLCGHPEWAMPKKKRKRRKAGRRTSDSDSDSDDSDSDDEGILRRTGNLLSGSVERLPQGSIDIKRMKDANSEKRAQAVVQSVEFHPTANVILTAGFHKTLDLFQVDGQVNPKLQSIHLERFPIVTAHFTRDGREVVMAGHRRSFYVYDMMGGKVTRIRGIRGRDERFFEKFVVSPNNELLVFLGKDGYMPLVSNKTKQWVADLKMNGMVRDVTFTPDSRYMLSTGSDGKVYVWDMSTRDCVHCFTDEGCLVGLSLSVSQDGRRFACGSDSGVVNVYDEQCLRSENPRPLKALMNLTTAADHCRFNCTSELLAMGSQQKKDSLKLVHIPSLTVFSNWPTAHTPLGYISAIDISPQSRHLAIGNDKGKVLLYRLNHYHKGL